MQKKQTTAEGDNAENYPLGNGKSRADLQTNKICKVHPVKDHHSKETHGDHMNKNPACFLQRTLEALGEQVDSRMDFAVIGTACT